MCSIWLFDRTGLIRNKKNQSPRLKSIFGEEGKIKEVDIKNKKVFIITLINLLWFRLSPFLEMNIKMETNIASFYIPWRDIVQSSF